MNKLFDKYESDESFTRVSISQQMFDLFIELDSETEDEKEILEAISKLDGMKVLFNDDVNSPKYFDEAMSATSKQGFEELMTVDDAEGKVRFMIRKEGGKIGELLMVMSGNREFAALSLFGEIDLKSISKVARVMDVKGLDRLQQLND